MNSIDPSPSVQRALIYMTGRNCERYVSASIESVVWQTHPAVHVLFVDDASDDHTFATAKRLLADYFPGRHSLIRNPEPWGKARNAHVHLRAALAAGDFVAVLDADDQLASAEALSRLAAGYAAGHDVVWTNYVTDGGMVGSNGPLDPNRSPRGQGWKTSHFFSFRAELLRSVDEQYFKADDGSWLMAACDFAIAFPILDQTRRYLYIPENMYLYTASNPQSHHNADPASRGLNSTIQMRNAKVVLGKAPLPCLRDPVQRDAPVVADKQPTGNAAGRAWEQAAAQHLAGACPAILALPNLDAVAPLQAWALWRRLQKLPSGPKVLELGHGPWAAVLAVMTQSLGGSFWSIGLDGAGRQVLEQRLSAAEMTQNVSIGTTRLVETDLYGTPGQFPDLRALGDEGSFNLAWVSVDQVIADPASAAHALPALSWRLAPVSNLMLATGSRELQQLVTEVWAGLEQGLVCIDASCHGLGLWVSAGEPMLDSNSTPSAPDGGSSS